jgi:hypothetical protein
MTTCPPPGADLLLSVTSLGFVRDPVMTLRLAWIRWGSGQSLMGLPDAEDPETGHKTTGLRCSCSSCGIRIVGLEGRSTPCRILDRHGGRQVME